MKPNESISVKPHSVAAFKSLDKIKATLGAQVFQNLAMLNEVQLCRRIVECKREIENNKKFGGDFQRETLLCTEYWFIQYLLES